MAKPIKNTPVLKGKDALNFYTQLEAGRDKKIDRAMLLAIRDSAVRLRSILRSR